MKSGFVSLIGRPNAGKSTLLNHILGEKIAIVSDKPQTTRNRILGIYNDKDSQVIFVDTPGVHKPRHRLGEYMAEATNAGLFEGDIVYYVVDATKAFGGGEAYIIERFKRLKIPVYLLLNKIDLLAKEDLLALIAQWQERYNFTEIFPISALQGDNVDRLLEVTLKALPEGIAYYPSDIITDQPERQVVAELIREKVFMLTEEEIPHSTAVTNELMERRERDDKLIIHGLIYLERDSQKGIVIGKGGKLLKQIGILARKDIEHLLGEEVYLKLWVKVKRDWQDKGHILLELGFDKSDLM
mgnify:FL=1